MEKGSILFPHRPHPRGGACYADGMGSLVPSWLLHIRQRRAAVGEASAREQAFLDETLGLMGEVSPRVLVENTRQDPVCLPSLALPGGGRIAMPPATGVDGAWRRFQLLHEAAHCLVHAQRAPFASSEVAPSVVAAVNEWVLAPLHQSDARDAFTERWADAWAALVMRRLGPEKEAALLIERVAASRASARARPEASAWSFIHDTASVLRAAAAVPLCELREGEGATVRGHASVLASASWWRDCNADHVARHALDSALTSLSPEPWFRERTLDARCGATRGHDCLMRLMEGHPLLPTLASASFPLPVCRDTATCAFESLVARARPTPVARSALVCHPDWKAAQDEALRRCLPVALPTPRHSLR